MIAHPLEPKSFIRLLRLEILLPHTQPHISKPPLPRQLLNMSEQRATNPSPMEAFIDIQALQLDLVLQALETRLRRALRELHESLHVMRARWRCFVFAGDEEIDERVSQIAEEGGVAVGGLDVGFEIGGGHRVAEGVGEGGYGQLGDGGDVARFGAADYRGSLRRGHDRFRHCGFRCVGYGTVDKRLPDKWIGVTFCLGEGMGTE